MSERAPRVIGPKVLNTFTKLIHKDTKKRINEGDIVLRNGDSNQYRLLQIMFRRQRVTLIDIELEDKENPHDRKEARAEDIDAKWA